MGELLSTDQHRSPYHTYMTVAHFLLIQRANVAHTGVTHLHWSFSVDQDVFSPLHLSGHSPQSSLILSYPITQLAMR